MQQQKLALTLTLEKQQLHLFLMIITPLTFHVGVHICCRMVEIADLNDQWAEYAGPGGWNGRTCDNQNKILHLSLQIACHSAVFLHWHVFTMGLTLYCRF